MVNKRFAAKVGKKQTLGNGYGCSLVKRNRIQLSIYKLLKEARTKGTPNRPKILARGTPCVLGRHIERDWR
jgi:hypothetical protein